MSARAALDVAGVLRVASPRSALTVRGESERVVVDARDGRALGDLWALRRARRGTSRPTLRSFSEHLASSDLTIDVSLADRAFFHIGAGARPGAVSRLLFGPHASLSPIALLRAWMRQRRGTVRS
jgi:hypothetical protein